MDIIIVNYKSTDFLIRCLKSIYDTVKVLPVKVFVQDNNSGDDLDPLRALFPQVDLTKNTSNMGFAKAINKALEKCRAPFIMILNPDTVIVDGFFEFVFEYVKLRQDVGILGPEILNSDGSVQGSVRSFPTLLTALFGRNTLLTKYFPNNPITVANVLTTRSDGIKPIEVDWVSGACMVIRKKALDDVGYLDSRFFMYWEDADLCRRMWQNRWKVVYLPQAKVIHYVGGSSEKNVIRSTIEFHKSCYRLFDKHRNPSLWFLRILVIQIISLRILFVLPSNVLRRLTVRVASKPRAETPADIKSRKIKILRIIARLNIGGPAIHVHLLTKCLDSKKFQSTLLTGKISPQEGDMGYLFDSQDEKPIIIPGLQREINPVMDLKVLFKIFKTLNEENPDIVHSHTAKAGTVARIAVALYNLFRRQGVLMVHTFHGHVFEGYFGKIKSHVFLFIEYCLAKVTDRIIAISETQKRDLSRKYHIAPASKIKTVELGFDLSPFLSNKPHKGHFRHSIGVSNDTTLVGIFGRLVPIKNHLMFFDGAKMFLDQNSHIDVSFIVVGDGELRDELEKYCEKKGLTGYVRFCGWVKDVPLVYADIDILALTSLNEGTPVSIIEAMASSIPVIATDVGGVMDLLGPMEGVPVSDGFVPCERGLMCRKEDARGFAKGLKYLMDVGNPKNKERVRRARAFVENRYSSRRLVKDIEALYLELTGRS